MENTLFILLVLVATLHVLEEYFLGWLDFVNDNKKELKIKIIQVKITEFLWMNIAFIALVALAFFIKDYAPVYSLSIVFLVFANIIVYVVPTIKLRKYMQGLYNSLIGYLPLSVLILFVFIKQHNLSLV